MFVFEAEDDGFVSFTGLISKATSNIEELAETQNGYNDVWIPGVNWADAQFNWNDGDSYTISMWLVNASNSAELIMEKTFTSEFAYLFPHDQIRVAQGEKVVFGYKCNALGSGHDEWETSAICLLSSQVSDQVVASATASVTNNSSRGTVTGITNGTVYNEGDVLDITITPKTGYKIASVTWNGVEQTVNANGMTLSKTVDITGANLVVTYVATYSVTITNNNAQGTVNANFTSGSTYEQGKSMNAVISAKTGYKISSVKWNGVEKLTGKVTSYTLSETLTQNSSLVVTYVATVTSNVSFDSAKGSVSGITTGQTLYVGENVYISVTALDGYKIKSIYWNGSYISITNTSSMYLYKTITTAGANLSVVYEEDINYYNLTLIGDTSKGTFLNFVDGAIVEEGDSLPITITANTNYVIASVKWNGVPQTITDNKTISFTKTITQDVVLEVEFKNEYYVPNISVTEGGEIIGLSQPKYQLGTSLTITLVANNNYQISSVIYNGQAIEITDAEYMSFNTNVGYDGINIEVVFTIEKYTAVVNYDSDFGVVSGIMNGVKYAYGTKLVINIVPEFGYEISSVIFNGIIEEVTKSAMTLNKVVGEDGLSLSVEFAKKSPIASVEYDAEAVSVSGIVDGDAYLFGSQVTIVIEANAGYEITDIQWNGEYEDVDLSEGIVTLTKTIGDKGANLVVETARKKYVANIIAPKGSVNIKGIEHGKSYEMGTTLTIEITVNKGYELLTIFYNDEAVQFDLGAKKVVITKTVPIGKINLVIAAAPLPKGATGCALSLASALPVGSIMLAGAVAMLFIKKKRNND